MTRKASVGQENPEQRWLAPIREKMAGYQAAGRRMFATTSCQSNSVVLLHVLSEVAPQTPVYFLNTGYVMQLFTDPRGNVMLGVGFVSLALGIFSMWKLVRFEI